MDEGDNVKEDHLILSSNPVPERKVIPPSKLDRHDILLDPIYTANDTYQVQRMDQIFDSLQYRLDSDNDNA
jgi:hypothetical protein